jgi:hypothetical protein
VTARRRWPAVAVAVAGTVATAGAIASATAAATAPAPAAARLQGFYKMSGRVTAAVNVGGERPGERVTRLWAFSSFCATGPCPTVALTRRRAFAVSDKLVLHERAPGFYVATGTFYGPVLCQGHRIARGTRAPFRITVRVLAAATAPSGQVLATRLRATYRNRSRTGLTRCVSAPAHDAVQYTGRPYSPPAVGSTRSVASTRSTASS